MTRKTSIAAYNEIKDSGTLSKRRWEVYSVLFKCGPCTANELYKKMPGRINNSNVVTRLGELRDMGVVDELGTRECSVTGRIVILWDVNDRQVPRKLNKRVGETRKQLEERCNNYRKALKAIWNHEDTPKWVKRLIRENVPKRKQ